MSNDKKPELKVPPPEPENQEDTKTTEGESPAAAQLDASLELEKLKAELADYKDKYLRALAESKNTVMRAQKERSEFLKYEGEKILRDIVEVADNLERAILHSGDDIAKVKDGLTMVNKQLVDTLARWGVIPEDSKGKPFSPDKHFALSKVVTTDHPPGTVIDQLSKPYYYKDKLLRPGQVVVAAKE